MLTVAATTKGVLLCNCLYDPLGKNNRADG